MKICIIAETLYSNRGWSLKMLISAKTLYQNLGVKCVLAETFYKNQGSTCENYDFSSDIPLKMLFEM